jgi:hypothetical protein
MYAPPSMHFGQFSSYDISRLRPSKFNNIPSLCTWHLMFVAICKFVKLWKKLWYVYGSILCFILISCKDPQSSILFSLVMGNFDWPIKIKKSSFGQSQNRYGAISSFVYLYRLQEYNTRQGIWDKMNNYCNYFVFLDM